jgi:hypothetical protein
MKLKNSSSLLNGALNTHSQNTNEKQPINKTQLETLLIDVLAEI